MKKFPKFNLFLSILANEFGKRYHVFAYHKVPFNMYKRNFLKQVILRVDFSKPIETPGREALDSLKSRFAQIGFGEVTEAVIQNLEVDLSQKASKVSIVGTNVKYSMAGGKNRFELQNDYFLLSVAEHRDSPSFFGLFSNGFGLVKELVTIDTFKRVGLRYINSIANSHVSIDGWQQFINNPYALSYNDLLPEPQGNFSLRRSMLRFVVSDGEFSLNVNTGIWNQQFPSKPIDHDFIVDIDCYVSNLILSNQDIVERLPRMDKLCLSYFRKIITKEFETKLKEESEGKGKNV